MLVKAFRNLHRAALVAALALALVATGFGHRLLVPQSATQEVALAFAFANGVPPADFCGSTGGDSRSDPLCLACQISGGADLPPVAETQVDLCPAMTAQVVAPRESRAPARVRDPGHAPQGPPLV